MPLARLDALGLSLYGGTILPGLCEGKEEHLDAQSVMEVIPLISLNLPQYQYLHKGCGLLWSWAN